MQISICEKALPKLSSSSKEIVAPDEERNKHGDGAQGDTGPDNVAWPCPGRNPNIAV